MLEIDDHHGDGFLLSKNLMEKRAAIRMTNRVAGPPRSENAPPTAQRSPPQPSDHNTLRKSAR